MTNTPRNSLLSDRIGGGGAATSAGIRFQQRLGALFSSWILASDRFHDSFRLGAAVPQWIRFETEAPVDDLLIKTSVNGYVAVQAKTTVSLSEGPNSPLSKTIAQFVRHWLAAEQGDGSMEWNRPLDPMRDRLVLAISPSASLQVRVDLQAALLLASQPGGGALNEAQKRAFQVFSRLVEQAWGGVTKRPFDHTLPSKLAKLITIFTFDGDQGYASASGSLLKTFGPNMDAATLFTVLSDLSGQLMSDRGGGDLSTLRRLLAQRGIRLNAPPEYLPDIETLKRHSEQIADALSSYEKIKTAEGTPLAVHRDCQLTIEAAVRNGPLLIIGEPGAGKSGVLNAVARKLRADDCDVLQLAVDRYSIESLEGLSSELGLQHPLLDVLEAWDGSEPAYLIIDALDATRGGRGEAAFRTLIERILERNGRWNVVASIRNFDLRMGRQFRALFKGKPPEDTLADPSFGEVQHIQVPPWTEAEFQQLLEQSPELAACLATTSPRLRELAMVPFNTRLLSELITGEAVNDLGKVASQADLLRLYWDHRVGSHGLQATSALSRVVQLMVQARALRAPTVQAVGSDPAIIEILCQEGVLVVVENERWIQFRHHLLFDYAAARLVLDPSTLASGTYRFRKADALGLMLSPALGFVLREVWESEVNHAQFWTALNYLICDEDGDPIIRSTAGRLGAEFPTLAKDCLWLGNQSIAGDAKAAKTLSHVSGALVVRLEDESNFSLEPWTYLADCLATSPAAVAGTLRFLIHNLVERVTDDSLRSMLGHAARALLAHGLSQPDPGFIVRSAIDFVIATYDTEVALSRALLANIFDSNRLDRFGHEEVPAVCYKITAVGNVDPEFVTFIYKTVFEYEVTEDCQTHIGQSQILNLTSNAQQDYRMARWSLGEYLPKFLQLHPHAAIRAVINAVEGYIAREHPPSDKTLDVKLHIDGRLIHLREDHSYVWAHDPDSQYGRDAESLVLKLRTHLKAAPVAEAIALIDILMNEASFAIFWSRMFLCAVERGDGVLDKLLAIAMCEPFLVLPDTRKDAIDLVATGILRRSEQERHVFERTVMGFDFSSFKNPLVARQAFLERIFTAIGRNTLVTDEARQIVDSKPPEQTSTNERLFVINTGWKTPEDLYWIKDLDKQAPENSSVIQAINTAKTLLKLEAKSEDIATASLEDSLASLQAIKDSLAENLSHPSLREYAKGIIGQGCDVIVTRRLLASKKKPPTPEQDAIFTTLLTIAGNSTSPELDADTESNFEESASWGSPAARVEAAQAYWDLLVQRADLYPELKLKAKELLSDPHPAVRLNASIRLVRIWDLDREQFWQLLTERFENEPNLTVIEHLLGDIVSRLIHTDQQRSLELLLLLMQREAPDSDRERRLFKAMAGQLTILWVTYQSAEAKAILDRWLAIPWKYTEEVTNILQTLGGTIVEGIGDTPDQSDSLRRRSRALVLDIVNAINPRLADYIANPQVDETAIAEARQCATLIDKVGMQMFFAIGDGANNKDGIAVLNPSGLAVFFQENRELLKQVGEYAQPHTIYYLLQLVERLVCVDASAAFDLAASFLQTSSRSGYQNEPLGVDLMVRLIGIFLADNKEIFDEPARRATLVSCLEIFLEAGWPPARRLLYRLPELIQ